MKLVSIETIPGQEFEALDIVRGTVVYSKNFGRDFMALSFSGRFAEQYNHFANHAELYESCPHAEPDCAA